MTEALVGSQAAFASSSAASADGRPGASVSRPAPLATFAEVADAIRAEFAGADAVSLRDLVLLRFAAERRFRQAGFEEMAKVHRQIAAKERALRAGLRGKGEGRASLRTRLEERYAAVGRAP